ncbi:MAG: YidC/Oxa1 family membrane protein insertase [Acidobacteria bacterium OLB17]|nr:MAG: YidC/Oxa1 family membrane protein insertase [Acidobacteria bacterium OLB17]MCZ2390646.1 membrane protein insertase YidC [Acidobacteriota bacterium]
MENSNNTDSQKRFLIAAVLCVFVLFGWQYFFAPKKPAGENANANTNSNATATAAPTPAPTTAPAATPAPEVAAAPSAPNRKITIKTPLYEVTLDSKGAVATSWVILKNISANGEQPIFADGSTAENEKPLQLISEAALSRDPRELPFRLATGDANLDRTLNTSEFSTASETGDVTLKDGETKQIDFNFTTADGVEAVKSFIFRGDSFVSDVSVKLTRGGQAVPNVKLLIGASLGDQAITHHSYYHIEPEAVAYVDDAIFRHPGTSFTFDTNNAAQMPAPGAVDWAGVADAYFAQAAVPASQTEGLEYIASKYEYPLPEYYDGIISWVTRKPKTSETRHLITAAVPVAADGTPTKVYTGPKDYFAFAGLYNKSLTEAVGRPIDLVDTINFSNYRPLRWFTKPIGILVLYALSFFDQLTRNYGAAIIIFTFLFYMLLFPLRWSQTRSFKKASGNAPKMKEVQDKIKELQKKGVPMDDPKMRALQMEQLRMTKDALPLGGCLPMILQFPLLLAFYTAVTVSLDIRQAHFLWLPDLSAADPYHILEFAFAISMILSMKFTPQAATVTPEQQMQQKMMTYFMPVMMLWVMWSAPSGLLLYWFFGNLVSFGQQMIINRMNKPNTPPGTTVVNDVPKNAKPVKQKLSTT